MVETVQLTESEIIKIALGYKWYPDMSYHSFCFSNPKLVSQESYNIFVQIEYRYIAFMYENK